MKLQGKLDKFDIAGLLQMLAMGRRSGKLTLTQYGGQGVIVLRQGKIIYAASSSPRETVGNILVCKGLIDEAQLRDSLEEQQRTEKESRLGAILVANGLIEQADLEQVMVEQIETVVSEFLGWESGFFTFEEFELPDQGEVAIEARSFLAEGVLPDQVLLTLSHQLDEAKDDGGSQFVGNESISRHLTVEPSVRQRNSPRSLRAIISEFRSPAFTGEVTLKILNYGQQIVRRGVLFSSGRSGVKAIGQFGIEPPSGRTPDFIRELSIPDGEPSVVTEAIARKAVVCGPLDQTPANMSLLEQLGGGWPTAAVVAPLIVSGRVLLIFYGDNLPQNEAIGSVDELELVMMHAGLAMEKNLLAKRVEHLEELQGRAEGD